MGKVREGTEVFEKNVLEMFTKVGRSVRAFSQIRFRTEFQRSKDTNLFSRGFACQQKISSVTAYFLGGI